MNKYIPVSKLPNGKQDLNEVAELRDQGKCFVLNGHSVAPTMNDSLIDIKSVYMKLDPEYDTWVALDIKKWKEWALKCIGKDCEITERNGNRYNDILTGFDTSSSGFSFKAKTILGDYCRVKKSLLEGE